LIFLQNAGKAQFLIRVRAKTTKVIVARTLTQSSGVVAHGFLNNWTCKRLQKTFMYRPRKEWNFKRIFWTLSHFIPTLPREYERTNFNR